MSAHAGTLDPELDYCPRNAELIHERRVAERELASVSRRRACLTPPLTGGRMPSGSPLTPPKPRPL